MIRVLKLALMANRTIQSGSQGIYTYCMCIAMFLVYNRQGRGEVNDAPNAGAGTKTGLDLV